MIRPMPKNPKHLTVLIVVVLLAVVGTYFIINSRASSPFTSVTATSGTLAGDATTQQNCSGSTSDSCVLFPTTGASAAVCNPSPCTAGSVPTATVNMVNLGNINNGSVDQTRTY